MTQIIRPSPPLINSLRIANPNLATYLTQLSQLSSLDINQIIEDVKGNNLQLLAQGAALSGTVKSINKSGLYLVSVQHETQTTSVAGKLRTVISWADEAGAKTRVLATDVDLSSADEEDGIMIVRVKAGTQITYATTLTGLSGTPTYNLFIYCQGLT